MPRLLIDFQSNERMNALNSRFEGVCTHTHTQATRHAWEGKCTFKSHQLVWSGSPGQGRRVASGRMYGPAPPVPSLRRTLAFHTGSYSFPDSVKCDGLDVLAEMGVCATTDTSIGVRSVTHVVQPKPPLKLPPSAPWPNVARANRRFAALDVDFRPSSPAASEDARKRVRVEAKALESLAACMFLSDQQTLVLTRRSWSSTDRADLARSAGIPMTQEMHNLVLDVATSCDRAERSSENDLQEGVLAAREVNAMYHIGQHFTEARIAATDGPELVDLVDMGGWHMLPVSAETGHVIDIPDNTYGTTGTGDGVCVHLGLANSKLLYSSVTNCTTRLLEALPPEMCDNIVGSAVATTGRSMASTAVAQLVARLWPLFNPHSACDLPRAEWLRALTRERYMDIISLHSTVRGVKSRTKQVRDARRVRYGRDTSLFMEALFNADLLQPIVDEISARAGARLLQVVMGYYARMDKEGRDLAALTILRRAFPSLQVFSVPNEFPHSDCELYANRWVNMPVAFVRYVSRRRVRADHYAALVAEANLNINPVPPPLDVAEFGKPGDYGYRNDEDTTYCLKGHLTSPLMREGARLKNRGWSRVRVRLDPDRQWFNEDFDCYFGDAPTLKVELVDVATGNLFDSSSANGGIELDPDLALINYKPQLAERTTTREGQRRWVNETPYSLPSSQPEFADTCATVATMLRFRVKNLSSHFANARFKVVVTLSGPRRTAPAQTLRFCAESPPLKVVSDARSRTGGKRARTATAAPAATAATAGEKRAMRM